MKPKRKIRFLRCIFHDKVDTIMWLVILGLFIYSQISGTDVSEFLIVLFFYVYYFMYRKFTFWQDRRKMYQELKNQGFAVDWLLETEDW